VRVRHRLHTDAIIEINREMSPIQRQMTDTTPFKWLLRLEQPLHILSVVLRELISRWCSVDQSFQIRGFLVPFSLFDVCMTLGQGVTGEEVALQDGGAAFTNCLLNGSEITSIRCHFLSSRILS